MSKYPSIKVPKNPKFKNSKCHLPAPYISVGAKTKDKPNVGIPPARRPHPIAEQPQPVVIAIQPEDVRAATGAGNLFHTNI